MMLYSASRLACVILLSSLSFSTCMSITEAARHVGENRCVKGKILRVDQSEPGFARLSFCGPQEKCAFTALVGGINSDNLATLQELQGKTIEIRGLVTDWEGNAKMVLPDSKQLVSNDYRVPSFMKAYDVEERGHYSAGTSHAPKTKRTTRKKQTSTLPIDIPEDTESSEDR